ncbi:hypothetical protein DF032_02000 [Burkholderia seminalis]|nr:hypothetical protein DF032_02000 [Burkholderia seminalis]
MVLLGVMLAAERTLMSSSCTIFSQSASRMVAAWPVAGFPPVKKPGVPAGAGTGNAVTAVF